MTCPPTLPLFPCAMASQGEGAIPEMSGLFSLRETTIWTGIKLQCSCPWRYKPDFNNKHKGNKWKIHKDCFYILINKCFFMFHGHAYGVCCGKKLRVSYTPST